MAAVPAVLTPGECLGSTHFAPFSDLCWSRTLRRSKTAACCCDMGSALTLLQQAMVSTSAEARRLAVAKKAHAGHLRKDKQVRQQQCGTVARSPALATSCRWLRWPHGESAANKHTERVVIENQGDASGMRLGAYAADEKHAT